ncbi:MAG: PA14 domain-containing protein [Ferruginibacter sp.]
MIKKNLLVRSIIIFPLLICYCAFSQDGNFTFTLASSATTSAGVYQNDSFLVRTLWNNEKYKKGTYTRQWDGKDDNGVKIASPSATYKIKVLSNNVNYEWQGTIGNSSTNMTGPSKHRGYYFCMRGLAFSDNYGYFCNGYSEGSPSIGKFLISKPQEKINFYDATTGTADNNYVATDGINVYWGAFDAFSSSNTFVYGTKVSDDQETNFLAGTSYAVTHAKTYSKTIARLDQSNSLISGLAVQKTGNFLFVARSGIHQLQVLNKTTGALVQILSYTNARALCVDRSDNLWMVTGANTVSKYSVNANGTLSAAVLTLSGLVEPMATQVSADGNLITVADAGTSQQVKFFNNYTGAVTSIMGNAGGYTTDATVTNDKFYLNDLRGRKLSFIAYEPNGSFWVNDPGNYRVQHYGSNQTYIDRIMSLGATYSTSVDKNNIKRVFAGYLEFEVDYSVQNLTGSTGWTLVKNWGANVTKTYDDFSLLRNQTTLSNGRTYALIKVVDRECELVELMPSGTMRFTGMVIPASKILCNDGSMQDMSNTLTTITYKRFPLTGFDGIGNPVWSLTPQILAMAYHDNINGSPAEFPNSQIFSSTNKVVLFNPNIIADSLRGTYTTGNHLGLMEKGANNTYLFQTEKSTHRNYRGEYPNAGYFDAGNGVNNFAGGNVNFIDRNIITSYHGEFWKNSQTNKYNHYYDNGLAIGQFGTTRPDVGFGNHAAAMMAGNALTPVVVKDANGDLYLWHGDESDHSGVHRWKITGLNTITEQVISIPYPTQATPPVDYVDLMAGLPFDAPLVDNTAGWTRSPLINYNIPFVSAWQVVTSKYSYDKLDKNDIQIEFVNQTNITNTVNRDLGNNNVTNSWKITGSIAYPGNIPNDVNAAVQQYFEILDDADKVLTTFYPIINRSAYPITTSFIKANAVNLATATGTTIADAMNSLLPFSISIVNGAVTFEYGNYAPVTTTISDPTGNWRKPKTLRLRFTNKAFNLPIYNATVDLYGLKFYKDYSSISSPNQAPVANAGSDINITLPATSGSLNGSGTDADGTIASYSWTKVSGPGTGSISTPNSPSTTINGLTQGVYQYELTVTDNNGATAKDMVAVSVIAGSTSNNTGAILLPAVNPANTVNGLDYNYYEGSWNSLPPFSTLNPIKTGNVNNFDLSPANRGDQFGFSFTGFIDVPSDGQYTFYTSSDDGSSLYIDGVLVVANDGLHSLTERSGTIGLQAGKHAITGLFFEQESDEIFEVRYEGMGISKQRIPSSKLYRIQNNTIPVIDKTYDQAAALNLLPAVNPAGTVNGLDYSYYEGSWSSLPQFSSLNPIKTGTVNNFDLSPANRGDQFGFSFTGFIDVPSDGQYTFYTSSDDGSNLYIDGVLVVANDGLHSSTERSGIIGLQAGKHAISGLFFEQEGDEVFNVSYQGMGILKQAIPASALYRIQNDNVRVGNVVTSNQLGALNLLPAVYPANTANGLDYKYYEGNWNSLPQFSSLNPVKTGTIGNFDLSPANRLDQFGFSFSGFINVPVDGGYTFYTSSDDGSNLYIDGVLVVANDGLHNLTEKSGTIGLEAGKHVISGLFFEQAGDQIFNVSYEGMGILKQTIPATVLYRINDNNQFASRPAASSGIAVTTVIDSISTPGVGNVANPKFSKSNEIKVYPNPVKDIANLSITTNGKSNKLSISLYNASGMLVSAKQLSVTQVNTIYPLNMSGLSAGIYSVIVVFEDGQKISAQIVKDSQ